MTWIRGVVIAALVAGTGLVASPAPIDEGAGGAWQRLLKLRMTASVLHTTAHPDDEHGGVLAWLSRGMGARVSLLTLNRGESGDNAIGPELFDALGLIRTEELLRADEFYGVDQQYFSTVVDYGFSKRLDEALEKWGRDTVLADVVRVIRIARPLVVISRFQGNERDGHGNHQAAGLITQDAFRAAADPNAFPEQLAEGLRPWQARKVYCGGVRENEDWSVRVDTSAYSPWLGDTYENVARLGLSFQRSQNSGRLVRSSGPSYAYYKRVGSVIDSPARERSFFDGIDTSLQGLFAALGRPEPSGARALLQAIEREVEAAGQALTLTDPSAAVPALVRGLSATRTALARLASEPDASDVLRVKEQQFQEALNATLGLELTALAQPAGFEEPTGAFAAFVPPAVMGNVVPGQTFGIRATLANRARQAIRLESLTIEAGKGWTITPRPAAAPTALGPGDVADARFVVKLDAETPITRNYFGRTGLAQNQYAIRDAADRHRPWTRPAALAVARYSLNGVPVETRTIVRRRESSFPYGYALRELMVVPALSVVLTPETAIVPLTAAEKKVSFRVDVTNNASGPMAGEVGLELPRDWTATPPRQPFRFSRPGEQAVFAFAVDAAPITNRGGRIEAVARVGAMEFSEGHQVVAHRDLETRYLYRMSSASVRGVDVTVPQGLVVGYVMGVGDQVPEGIAQLGIAVRLLREPDLATGDLRGFDAIVTGTRAYAVREDLRTYNRRLLEYVQTGGNLVVLYNTQEYVPAEFAPYPAELTARAEEVSEEDSPVEILAPAEPVLNWPNRISEADFRGWVEQRGSKFFSAWDDHYTPIIATWDKGQSPQKGGWLHARYGQGHFTYFAYAFHRQLPYGVPGAYRLLANMLSQGKAK